MRNDKKLADFLTRTQKTRSIRQFRVGKLHEIGTAYLKRIAFKTVLPYAIKAPLVKLGTNTEGLQPACESTNQILIY